MNSIFRLQLNTSNRFHLNLGFFISIWCTAFLIIISPYDVEKLSLLERIIKMPLYGLIIFFSYSPVILIQNYVRNKSKQWTVLFELSIFILFGLLLLMGSFLYYQSIIIGGGNSFGEYFRENFLPIFLIISLVLVFLRFFYQNRSVEANNEHERFLLKGENKLDILDIKATSLVCVFGAGNYVEVFYLEDEIINKKLIRSTLKNIHNNAPYLKKVHRSRLINPIHLVRWKDSSTLILTQKEVGVSRKFKKNVNLQSYSSLKDVFHH